MPSQQLSPARVLELHARAGATRWAVSVERFAEALEASVARGCAGSADMAQLKKYVGSLRLDDLALACACADGHDGAWDHFVREYRPTLYRAADALDASGGAREVADALYADLFGLRERDGVRQSLFRHFHGRSSLATWLRAVLAQRYVDRIRAIRRVDPLPEEDGPRAIAAPVSQARGNGPCLDALGRTFTAAVAGLDARDRLRLACYYAEGLTLAQIGRLLHEHEATVSRHLTRVRRAIRAGVEDGLRRTGMAESAISDCLNAAAQDSGTLDLADLLTTGGKDAGLERSR